MAVGLTTNEPAVAFPVENPVPIQRVEFIEDQLSVLVCPALIVVELAESAAVGMGRTSTPSIFALKSTDAAVVVNVTVIFPLASATWLKHSTTALCAAPAVAKISKFVST